MIFCESEEGFLLISYVKIFINNKAYIQMFNFKTADEVSIKTRNVLKLKITAFGLNSQKIKINLSK